MKTLIIKIVILSLVTTGCSTTTYLNFKETNLLYIGMPLKNVDKDRDVGVEVSILLKSDNVLTGEMLFITDSSMTICTEYSATEKELVELTYNILIVKNNEIKELTIEGSSYVWLGIAAGAVGGGVLGALIIQPEHKTTTEEAFAKIGGFALGAFLGSIAGGVIGYNLSDETYVLQEIPHDFDWSILKSLSRYPDREPEYLKVIK